MKRPDLLTPPMTLRKAGKLYLALYALLLAWFLWTRVLFPTGTPGSLGELCFQAASDALEREAEAIPPLAPGEGRLLWVDLPQEVPRAERQEIAGALMELCPGCVGLAEGYHFEERGLPVLGILFSIPFEDLYSDTPLGVEPVRISVHFVLEVYHTRDYTYLHTPEGWQLRRDRPGHTISAAAVFRPIPLALPGAGT